jgi:ribose transport system substrate-binding protein
MVAAAVERDVRRAGGARGTGEAAWTSPMQALSLVWASPCRGCCLAPACEGGAGLDCVGALGSLVPSPMTTRREALLSLLLAPTVLSCTKALKIGVIPRGTTHRFWTSVHAGCTKAAKDLDVAIVWKGPLKEDDLKSQIDIVEAMVAQGVAGIVLAPLDDKALVGAVKKAAAAKIPVVIFDSALQGSDFVSFVSTDNVGAGWQAAKYLGKALDGKGRVLMLRYQEGSASTAEREQGFMSTIRAGFPNITVVSDKQYGGATTESAFIAAESLLAAQNATEGGVDGIFCPNESTTLGMLIALQKARLNGKIKLIGFDASEKLVKGLRDGSINALAVQLPFLVGNRAVHAIVDQLRGHPPQPRITIDVRLVTKDDLNHPVVKALIEATGTDLDP